MTPASTTAISRLGPTTLDLVALTKPRVTALVIATAAVGFGLAPADVSVPLALVTLLSTFTLVGSANVLNCWLERDSDASMERTRGRPLASGRLDPTLALGFGVLLALGSLFVLGFAVNQATFLLGLVALVSYVALYTPLKYKTPHALLVGAVPGALPPLMGWSAATGRVGAGGFALFLIVFLWQMPHVLGLSTYRRGDYESAGVQALPNVRGLVVARRHTIAWAAVLMFGSLLPVALGIGGPVYVLVAVALGGMQLAATLAPLHACASEDRDVAADRWGRRVFIASLLYLPALFLVLMLDAGG